MIRKLAALAALALALCPLTAQADISDWEIAVTAHDKVILDTDMGYLGDDAYCLCMLAQADAAGWIELLGVTSAGGNEICAVGTNAILNQLERIGREDIPVYIGTDVPILGWRDLEKDRPVTGGFSWVGGYASLENYVSPGDYHALGALLNKDWGYSRTEAQAMRAAEFMVSAARKYPGQVTIVAIGACTNAALACMLDPDFARNTAGIIYMGGAIDVPGNANACGEFNWFYDPEAAQICLNNPFPRQVVVPHDIAATAPLGRDVFDMMADKSETPVSKMFLEMASGPFTRDPELIQDTWDPITAAVLLCPNLITRSEKRDLAIDLNRWGYSYANAVTWASGCGPYAASNVEIVLGIDRDAFWEFVTDLFAAEF